MERIFFFVKNIFFQFSLEIRRQMYGKNVIFEGLSQTSQKLYFIILLICKIVPLTVFTVKIKYIDNTDSAQSQSFKVVRVH